MTAFLSHATSALAIPTTDARLALALDHLSGIDSLSKFNIVCYLHKYPSTRGDAAFFAQTLGFHSIEQTQAELDALVACGVLGRQGLFYCRTADPQTAHALATLCSLDPTAPEYRVLVQRLASRATHKKKKR